MTETNVNSNSDLLKFENEFYVKQSQNNSLLITKKALKSAITPLASDCPIKTERISSQVLSRAKQFLVQTKDDKQVGHKCDLIDESSEEVIDEQQVIEMNLLLFENKNTSKTELSDEENTSDESSDDESEDSEDNSEEETEEETEKESKKRS